MTRAGEEESPLLSMRSEPGRLYSESDLGPASAGMILVGAGCRLLMGRERVASLEA